MTPATSDGGEWQFHELDTPQNILLWSLLRNGQEIKEDQVVVNVEKFIEEASLKLLQELERAKKEARIDELEKIPPPDLTNTTNYIAERIEELEAAINQEKEG
jgi:hypothetical protein